MRGRSLTMALRWRMRFSLYAAPAGMSMIARRRKAPD